MKKRVFSDKGRRNVRIGRKAILSTRVIRAIESKPNVGPPRRWSVRNLIKSNIAGFRPTPVHLVILTLVVVVILGSAGGYTVYQKHLESEHIAAQKAFMEKEKVVSKRAAACRKTIVETNPDKIGKVTYSQLYGDECKN